MIHWWTRKCIRGSAKGWLKPRLTHLCFPKPPPAAPSHPPTRSPTYIRSVEAALRRRILRMEESQGSQETMAKGFQVGCLRPRVLHQRYPSSLLVIYHTVPHISSGAPHNAPLLHQYIYLDFCWPCHPSPATLKRLSPNTSIEGQNSRTVLAATSTRANIAKRITQ